MLFYIMSQYNLSSFSFSRDTTELVIGAGEPILIDILVANDGEDAFEAVFVAQFPEGLQFVRVERKQLVGVMLQCVHTIDINKT